MCGIVGLYRSHAPAGGEQRLAAAMQVLARRGPDDAGSMRHQGPHGTLLLGHRRLAVLDLTGAGRQPMTSNDQRFTIVYNGEIYNYRELRQRLQQQGASFHSHTDTEVLLEGWSRWGEDILQELDGMFAFAVLDRATDTLLLARDAFGIKPLYVWMEGGSFAFASELPALNAVCEGTLQPDHQAAYDYLVYGDYDRAERTFFASVRALAPGTLVRIPLAKGGTPQEARWWQPHIARRQPGTLQDAAGAVRSMFLDSVRLHLRSDVPIAAALSGGVDSASIVCGMRRVAPDMPLHTFTFVAAGSLVDEQPWADSVNRHTGAVSHKVLLSEQDLLRDLDDLIVTQGEPFGSTSIYAQYAVFRAAREAGFTVTLDGQGADEVFAGYHGYPAARLLDYFDEGSYADALRFARAWTRWPGRSASDLVRALGNELMTGRARQAALRLSGHHPQPSWLHCEQLRARGVIFGRHGAAGRASARGRRLASALHTALQRDGLPALLRHGDRNSMRWSVESRVPFLTRRLAEYTLSLPPCYLVSPAGETKLILRHAMRGIVPEEVLDRRDKVGFATPERDWLFRIAGPFRAVLAEGPDCGWLRRDVVLKHFDDVVAGRRRFTWQLWRWLNYMRWYQLCVSR
jgi:asparagine synthase (glutamine-hydrolysing)